MKKKLAASGDLYFALPANFLFPLRQFYKLSTSVDTFLDMILQHEMTNDYHISEKKNWLNDFILWVKHYLFHCSISKKLFLMLSINCILISLIFKQKNVCLIVCKSYSIKLLFYSKICLSNFPGVLYAISNIR